MLSSGPGAGRPGGSPIGVGPAARDADAGADAAPAEDPAVTAIARREFVAWQTGVVNKARYTPDLAAAITDDKVERRSTALAALGPFERSDYVGPATIADAEPGEDVRGYFYRMICSEGAVYMNWP